MKDETKEYLRKSERLLAEASKCLAVEMFELAGQRAYLAAVHAANAAVFEHKNEASSSHRNVRKAIASTLYDRGIADRWLTALLPNLAHLKDIADYETGEPTITSEIAKKAISDATIYRTKIISVIEKMNQPVKKQPSLGLK